MPLHPRQGAGAYIKDFVQSDDPRFKGKSKGERTRMALGAFYGAARKAGIRVRKAESLLSMLNSDAEQPEMSRASELLSKLSEAAHGLVVFDRVKLRPGGAPGRRVDDAYGQVKKLEGEGYVHVKTDSGKTVRVHHRHLMRLSKLGNP